MTDLGALARARLADTLLRETPADPDMLTVRDTALWQLRRTGWTLADLAREFSLDIAHLRRVATEDPS
jgi:hypothetical protein